MFLLTAVPFMYCDAPSAVAAIRKPVDATHAGAGSVTLASGANFEITKADSGASPSDGDRFLVTLRRTDRVQVCYAPRQHFADAGPTARMAIAGNVRTGDSVYTLAYPAKPVSIHGAAPAMQTTTYAMLVPTVFARIALGKPSSHVFVKTTRALDRYRIEVDLAPQCNGANVCSAGSFSGYGSAAFANGLVKNPPDGPLSNVAKAEAGEHAVALANGTTAFYKDSPSGASDGGNSSLRWLRNGTLYLIESRLSTPASLVATANSAIANASGGPG